MKKLGKLLLFGAAVGTAAAAAYHYLQKMDKDTVDTSPAPDKKDFSNDEEESYFDDEDFDDELDITIFREEEDLEEDLDEDFDDPTPDTDIEDMATTTPSFSPLAETLMQEDGVEEFFDEDLDDSTEE